MTTNIQNRFIAPILSELIVLTCILITGSCNNADPVAPALPACSIASPKNGAEFLKGEIKFISVTTPENEYGTGVTCEIDNTGIQAVPGSPLRFQWNTAEADTGMHTIVVYYEDRDHNETSCSISVSVIEASSAVSDTGRVKDYDGNTYKTVQIGSQWWMAENLKTTHFSNGTGIPLIDDVESWDKLDYDEKAMCYYNDSIAYTGEYGALYNWAATMNGAESSETVPSYVRGVCPAGWHIPSDEEWMVLEMALGMTYEEAWLMAWRGSHEGTKMKATHGWDSCGNGINSSGFSALPAGIRSNNGLFSYKGQSTHFWSSTEYVNITTHAFNRQLDYNQPYIGWFQASHYYGYPKDFGFSVRCVKD